MIIFAPESSISEPLQKFSNIKVILNGLLKADELKDYNENYKKYGLKRISVYD